MPGNNEQWKEGTKGETGAVPGETHPKGTRRKRQPRQEPSTDTQPLLPSYGPGKAPAVVDAPCPTETCRNCADYQMFLKLPRARRCSTQRDALAFYASRLTTTTKQPSAHSRFVHVDALLHATALTCSLPSCASPPLGPAWPNLRADLRSRAVVLSSTSK